MDDTIKRTLEYVMNSKGNAIVEMFYMDFSPIGEKIWNALVELDYVYEDEYGLIFLTPKGCEGLGMKVIHYKDEKGMLRTTCPYGTQAHSRVIVPKVGSGVCAQCRFFELNNTEKNYVICRIEMEKNKVEMEKIRGMKLGRSGLSGTSGYGGVSGTNGYGHISGNSITEVWIDDLP